MQKRRKIGSVTKKTVHNVFSTFIRNVMKRNLLIRNIIIEKIQN